MSKVSIRASAPRRAAARAPPSTGSRVNFSFRTASRLHVPSFKRSTPKAPEGGRKKFNNSFPGKRTIPVPPAHFVFGKRLGVPSYYPPVFAPTVSSPSRSYSTEVDRKKEAQRSSNGTGIVMLNLGGPRTLEDVHTFLLNLFSDREIIQLPLQAIAGPLIARLRTPKVQKLYQSIGGGSPILKWTQLQGEGLVKVLDEISPETAPHKYYIAFRYAPPSTEEALKQMKKDGIKRAIAFTQYPQFSCTTTGSSLNEIWRSLKRLNMEDEFHWSVIDRWPTHNGYTETVAKKISNELDRITDKKDRDEAVIMFSAHSLPSSVIDRGDSYTMEISHTISKVMDKLKVPNPYMLSYQSAVGPRAWQGPKTDEMLQKLGARKQKNVIMVPIAFTTDHIETLRELDIDYKELALKSGVQNVYRSESLNDDPMIVKAMADIVHSHMHSKQSVNPSYFLRCPGCIGVVCRSITNPVPPPPELHAKI